jgi:hypothetical protein
MSAAYLLAWLLVAVAGIACALALSAPRVPGRTWMALGYGLVAGMLLAAGACAATARADTAHAWLVAAPWLGGLAIIAAVASLVRQWRAHPPPAAITRDGDLAFWTSILIALALASLLWRGSIAGSEVLLRPTYPWDAWDAWAVKSKTWFLLGHYAPFVPIEDWLHGAAADLRSGPAWAYPSTLAWMQVWFASAAGDWIEPLVNLPWLALWIGLLLGHYGQWRALGLCRTRAAIAVYGLGSLPLLTTHVALAGYADLWVATVFGFSLLAWLRWQERREADQLVLAILAALALPLLKLEGMVWCLCLLGAMGFGALPLRWRWRAGLALALLLVLVVVLGESQVLFAAIGWVRSGSRMIEIPVIGKLALAWHGDAARGLLYSLFLQSNWHLLWWLVPPLLVWRWRALRSSEALTLCALLLLACFCLLVFLFVFTDAAEWAESFTAVNRLIMHITPAVVTLLALLLREPAQVTSASDTAAAPAARSAPG